MTDKNTPLVSVCFPVYNGADFVAKALASVLAQSYEKLEIIIGDDQSTDGSADIIAAFKDPRITYLRHDNNLGQFGNINALLHRCHGEYVAIYHADDIYEPTIVAEEVSFLEAHPEVAAVMAQCWVIDTHDRQTGQMAVIDNFPYNTGLDFQQWLVAMMRHRNRFWRTPSFLARAKVISESDGFSEAYRDIGDFEFQMRLATQNKIAVLDEYLFSYRRSPTQITTSYNQTRVFRDDFFKVIDKYLTQFRDQLTIPVNVEIEYAFHRAADDVLRANNAIKISAIDEARAILKNPFPWRCLRIPTQDLLYPKLRTIGIRLLLKLALACGCAGLAVQVLKSLGFAELGK
ncbi:MAG: glycosyltransferase [Pseudomonadota bacterium]